MQTIGRIAIEDHLTPAVEAFNATRPPAEHVFLMSGSDAARVEQGNGPAGPFIRILPSPTLLATMGYALQERARVYDAAPSSALPT